MTTHNAIRVLFNHPYNENYQHAVIQALQDNITEFCAKADIFQVELNVTIPQNIHHGKDKSNAVS